MTRGLGKSSRAFGALLLAAIVFPRPAHSQSQGSAKPLTLAAALDYALGHYPAVRAALERRSAAQAGVRLARTAYLPQLTGAYQDSRATQNQAPGLWLPTTITPTVEGPIGASSGRSFWGSQAAALFSWEPIDFGLRSARVDQARSAENKSQADLALTRLEVARAVGDTFLLAAADRQTAIAAQANVARWQVFAKSVHVLADNQLRPGADASRADAELARARIEFYQAAEAERVALDTLAALIGAAGGEIQLDSGALLRLPASDSLPEGAASIHPLARDQREAVRQAQASEKAIERTDYPRLYLQAEALGRGSEVPNNGSFIGNGNGLVPARGNWVTGITILFPDLFGFKARSAEEQVSKADERSEQARYDQTIQDLTGAAQAALDRLKAAAQVAEETPTELAAARQAETQSRVRYQSGLATVVEVAEAENLLAQAETDDSIARLGVWRSLFGVAYARGEFGPFLRLLNGAAGGE